jgi:hypothetical protein
VKHYRTLTTKLGTRELVTLEERKTPSRFLKTVSDGAKACSILETTKWLKKTLIINL